MLNSYKQFGDNIKIAKELFGVYDHLTSTLIVPCDFSDILRSQIVYAVSAFDKFIHDIVKIGMIDIFCNRRPPTPKYNMYSFSLERYAQLSTATVPPKEYWFSLDIFQKHKQLSFQDPNKVADALSHIWNEDHKWQQISAKLGTNEEDVKTRLRMIIERRNTIVHEADIDPFSGMRYLLTRQDVADIIDFINNLAKAIYALIQ
jgi:hypothetical protein